MRLDPLPSSEFDRRVKVVQKELQTRGIDVLLGYSSENESATSRYFTGFWPFFDFAVVVIPSKGDAVLVTGGPESLEFAQEFSTVPVIKVNPLLVETSPPEWVPEVSGESMEKIVLDAVGKKLRKIGIANWNIFPHILLEDLGKAAAGAEIVVVDDIVLKAQSVKSDVEIPYIIEAYKITEQAMRKALEQARPGMREWELEAIARAEMITPSASAGLQTVRFRKTSSYSSPSAPSSWDTAVICAVPFPLAPCRRPLESCWKLPSRLCHTPSIQ